MPTRVGTTQPMTSVPSPMKVRTRLAPLGRAAQHKAIWLDNCIGEYAIRQRIAAHIDLRVGGLLERLGGSVRWKSDDDPLLTEQTPHRFDWPDQIAVGRHHQRHVKAILKGIRHQFDRDIHVRHLFVKGLVGIAAVAATDGIRKKMPV